MAKIRYGKWGCWIPPVGVLLSLFALIITAQQPGFLSIRCGAKTNYTDENNLTWVTDDHYIDVGEPADLGNVTEQMFGSSWHSLRYFPNPLNKSCYQLPVSSNVPCLLRLSFFSGNYSDFPTFSSFAYSIETVDILAMNSVTNDGFYYFDERILVTSGTMMYVCLIRTSYSVDPFISGIELRPLRDGMYAQAKPGTMLSLINRVDLGGNYSRVRYPQDNFDRIWTGEIAIDSSIVHSIRTVSTQELISTSDTEDLPPTAVMQTAWVVNSSTGILFPLTELFYNGSKSLLLLYFAEIEALDTSASRSFYVAINGDPNYYNQSELTLSRNYPIRELQFLSNSFSNFSLWNAANSTLLPIINAYELYSLINTEPSTYSQDIDALDAIKKSFDIKSWISDPCYLISWNGINCYNSFSGIRISEIDLSGRNLKGSVPNDIANLTALVSVYLDNNNLSGSLPNLSSLTLLERLYLQNNSLNGVVPEWLSELKNLKELNIENNNFIGVIPAQLLNCSLKLSYSGNPYLCRSKRECAARNSKYKKLKVLLGLMFSGILISALALIAGIIMYRHQKNKRVTTESNGVTNGPENGVDIASIELTDSTVMVPSNLTKSRAFTLEDMMAATQKFTGNIGKGGFGSVFFGKLPEGRDVAVKVLSLFNEQGIHQFLNEIDVLSKLHHKNLVSLLGHCNESRELMIIYEHMSRGSFKDRLYGPSPESSELNWKRRLKIALDAAQGLEYMHVVCTPKIIHRDIKTANILLDSNFNGKLGDFGLSRVWINGEASHVTTMVKGTAGYLDPEYFSTERLTDKSDVYSFGVVLLEIICGRPPIDAKLSVEKLNIIRWATPFVEMDAIPGQIEEIIDRRLGGNYNLESVTRVAKIAIRCVKAEPFYRPSVSEVVEELREAMKLEEICTRPAQSIS